MKKLTNSLGMAITIFLMLLANSCSKKDSIPGPADGGSGGGGNIPLSATARAVPDSLFPGSVPKIEWTANKNSSCNGTNGLSGYFFASPVISPVKNDTAITLDVTIVSGGEIAIIPVRYIGFSQNKKTFCWNNNTSNFGKWSNTVSKVSHDGGLTWNDGPKDPALWVTYLPGGSRNINLSGVISSSGWQIRYEGETIFINLAETFQPKNEYKVLTLTNSQMVIEQEKSGTIFRLTYQNS